MKRYLFMAVLFILAAVSCRMEEHLHEPGFSVVTNAPDGKFVLSCSESSLTDRTGLMVTVYSDSEWFVSLTDTGLAEGEEPWYSVYPDHGFEDGRFFINVIGLDSPYARTADLVITASDGSVLYSDVFTQTGTEPYLDLNDDRIPVGGEKGDQNFEVSSNLDCVAEVVPLAEGDDVSWLEVEKKGMAAFALHYGRNESGIKRSAVVRVHDVADETISRDITVTQFYIVDIDKAEIKTVDELLGFPAGEIDGNYAVEVFVTGDREAGNLPNGTDMFIQDAGGRGTFVRFAAAEDYKYDLNASLKISVAGALLNEDEDGIYLTGISSDKIRENSSSGAVPEPVRVENFADIDNYINTLVTLSGAEFAIPIGTPFNAGSWKDTAKETVAPVRDASGNEAFIRTSITYKDRHAPAITSGVYDITGIVTADKGTLVYSPGASSADTRLRQEKFKTSLRLRGAADIALTDGAAKYQTLVEWLGTDFENTTWWIPSSGTGEFNMFAFGNGSGSVTKSRVSYVLKPEFDAADDDNCYKGSNCKVKYDSSKGGLYFEFSTSTAGKTGNVYVSALMGAYGSASRYWKWQYSTDGTVFKDVPDGEFELWNMFSTSKVPDMSHLYCPVAMSVTLPSDASGAEKLTVRLTTEGQANKRTDGSDKAAATGDQDVVFFYVAVKSLD